MQLVSLLAIVTKILHNKSLNFSSLKNTPLLSHSQNSGLVGAVLLHSAHLKDRWDGSVPSESFWASG